ncbi:hypothetical protein DRQ29_04910 [bacterium]|nr:MAG: hypothetical protein DRQ29_04910 [bacterium]
MKDKTVITGKMIEITGSMPRHQIVKKVVNTFISTEYNKKGKNIYFRYPVEKIKNGYLFISRPGHKKNFDFKVDIEKEYGIGEGKHSEIGKDLKNKKLENEKKFDNFIEALTDLFHCKENDVEKLLRKYHLIRGFKTGAKVEILLKILKWMFIMEDIVYWDNEGRAFLFNFLRYVSIETDDSRLKEALEKIKSPNRLKNFMKKCGIEWLSY